MASSDSDAEVSEMSDDGAQQSGTLQMALLFIGFVQSADCVHHQS